MSYREIVESGRWPPTNRETIMFLVGLLVGALLVFGLWAAAIHIKPKTQPPAQREFKIIPAQ